MPTHAISVDGNPADPSTGNALSGLPDFSTLLAFASNDDAVAELGVNKLYKSTTLINNSPVLLITV